MASPESWLDLLSVIKAAFDFATSGLDFVASIRRHRNEGDTIAESNRISAAFSTYTDGEVRAASQRLRGCYERFIEQGGGGDRKRCICSVLREIAEGNGGQLPLIDDWARIFAQLNCAR